MSPTQEGTQAGVPVLPGGVRKSESELEGELDGAGATDLVQGVETAVGAAGAEAARQNLRRLAKEGVGDFAGSRRIWRTWSTV